MLIHSVLSGWNCSNEMVVLCGATSARYVQISVFSGKVSSAFFQTFEILQSCHFSWRDCSSRCRGLDGRKYFQLFIEYCEAGLSPRYLWWAGWFLQLHSCTAEPRLVGSRSKFSRGYIQRCCSPGEKLSHCWDYGGQSSYNSWCGRMFGQLYKSPS